MRRKLSCLLLIAALFFFIAFTPLLYGKKAYAADFGSGSAGDATITTAKNLSAYTNKSFRNLVIDSGGILTADQNVTIYVSQSLTIRNGGKITSSNGRNGYYNWDYEYGYSPVSAGPALTVTINAANIIIQSGGLITSGPGGTGYQYNYQSASSRWGPGSGGAGGNINLNFNSLMVNNGMITSGAGGVVGSGTAYKTSGGAGGGSGNVSLQGVTVSLTNNGKIETGNGQAGSNAQSCWSEDSNTAYSYAGSGGNSGSISVSGGNLSIDATSWVKTGTGGKAGIGMPEGSGTCYGAYGGNGGSSGSVSINGFDGISIYGLMQSGAGGEGGYSSEFRYNPATGTVGGNAGFINIAGSELRVYPSGRIQGGTGGKGGSLGPYYGSTGTAGTGGRGGDIYLINAYLFLDTGSLIVSGNGGLGGDGKINGGSDRSVVYTGGVGGQGGSLILNISNSIVKSNEINIRTGTGGYGGDYTPCYSSSGSYYYYYWNGGPGGKGGNAVLNLPANMNINYSLIEIGSGGMGHDVSYNGGTSGGQYIRTYNPGAGGATGDLTVNVTGNLTLSGQNVLRFARSGQGNVWTVNTAVKSQNGSSGNCTINVSGQLNFASDNTIYFNDMSHSGYGATNSSTLILNCSNIIFNSSRPIRWSNISGGTLNLTTDLRQFPYEFERLAAFTKEPSQTIVNYIFKFTWDNTADLLKDIPINWVQDELGVSFSLDDAVYDRYLKLFTSLRRYKSEDDGVNWQEITSGAMSKDYVWGAPSTLVGNKNLRIGITPYGFAPGISEIWLNGKKLDTYWTPTVTTPPAIASYKFTIADPAVLAKEAAQAAKTVAERVYEIVTSDTVPPVIDLDTVSGARATSAATITLLINASDNASTIFTYSINGGSYLALPVDGRVGTALLTGMNNIVVRVKDQVGNIAQRTIKVWKM